MKTTIPKTIAMVFLVAMVGFTGGAYGIFQNEVPKQPFTESGQIIGHLEGVVIDSDGYVKQYVQTDNVITDVGLDSMADLVFPDIDLNSNSTNGQFDWIGIGTGNTAAATTDVAEETLISGCNRVQDATVAGTSAVAGEITATVESVFTGTNCASSTVGEAVLSNSGTGAAAAAGEILARQTFADINLGSSDSLTVTWSVTFT